MANKQQVRKRTNVSSAVTTEAAASAASAAPASTTASAAPLSSAAEPAANRQYHCRVCSSQVRRPVEGRQDARKWCQDGPSRYDAVNATRPSVA